MPRIDIARLTIPRAADDKSWRHGITPDPIQAVPRGRFVVTANRAGRAAPNILIGRDEQGRCLAVPIVPTDDPLTWRVITAWYCKPSEAANLQLRQRRSRT